MLKLLAIMFIVLEGSSVQCSSIKVKIFTHDISLFGQICQEQNVIFQFNISRTLCGVKCIAHSSCSGIFYDQDLKNCMACSSSNGVVDAVRNKYKFYRLEISDTYIGCYNDSPRILSDSPMLKSLSMTTELCISHCLSLATLYAMTEFGEQCFCGNSDAFMNSGVEMPETDCNYGCPGNPSQICGGFARGSMYYTGVAC